MSVDGDCSFACKSKAHLCQVFSILSRDCDARLQVLHLVQCFNVCHNRDELRRSWLHVAASYGRHELISLMFNLFPDLVKRWLADKDLESGWTAFHRACYYGQLETARFLADNGCNLMTKDKTGFSGFDLLSGDRPSFVTYNDGCPLQLHLWGQNHNLNLGSGLRNQLLPTVDHYSQFPAGLRPKKVCLGKFHSIFLMDNGQVWGCGQNKNGRCGLGPVEDIVFTPRRLRAGSFDRTILVDLAVSQEFSVFLTNCSELYACGEQFRQLTAMAPELALNEPRLVPLKMPVVSGEQVKLCGVCCGRYHVVVWSSKHVMCFGLNLGQLGDKTGSETRLSQPRVVTAFGQTAKKNLQPGGVEIVSVVSTNSATIVGTTVGSVFLLAGFSCKKIFRCMSIKTICATGECLVDSNCLNRVSSDWPKFDRSSIHENSGSNSSTLNVLLLTKNGVMFLWREAVGFVYELRLPMGGRPVRVTDVALARRSFLFVTDKGEGFVGQLNGEPANISTGGRTETASKDYSNSGNVRSFGQFDVERAAKVERLVQINRGVSVMIGPSGDTFAVLQATPDSCLLDVPAPPERTLLADLEALLIQVLQCRGEEDARLANADMLLDFGYAGSDGRRVTNSMITGRLSVAGNEYPLRYVYPCHEYVVTERCPALRKFLTSSGRRSADGVAKVAHVHLPVEVVLVVPEFLRFLYTGRSHLMQPNTGCTAVLEGALKPSKRSKPSKQQFDPVDLLRRVAEKFGLKHLKAKCQHLNWTAKVKGGLIELEAGCVRPKPDEVRFVFDVDGGQTADLCLRSSDGGSLFCHRALLVARLEYFRCMLATTWRESFVLAGQADADDDQEDHIQMLDMHLPFESLLFLIRFLYTDELEVPSPSADVFDLLCSVLTVADQFLADRLKRLCEIRLVEYLDLRNCCEMLEFACSHSADGLATACMQFICINIVAVFDGGMLATLESDSIKELGNYYRTAYAGHVGDRRLTPWDNAPSLVELEKCFETVEQDFERLPALLETRTNQASSRRTPRKWSSTDDYWHDGTGTTPVTPPSVPATPPADQSASRDSVVRPTEVELPAETEHNSEWQKVAESKSAGKARRRRQTKASGSSPPTSSPPASSPPVPSPSKHCSPTSGSFAVLKGGELKRAANDKVRKLSGNEWWPERETVSRGPASSAWAAIAGPAPTTRRPCLTMAQFMEAEFPGLSAPVPSDGPPPAWPPSPVDSTPTNVWTQRQKQRQASSGDQPDSPLLDTSFSSIIDDERAVQQRNADLLRRPLHFIQIEDRAIAELLASQAGRNDRVSFSVERVGRQLFDSPVWRRL